MSKYKILLAVALACSLFAVACGSDDDDPSAVAVQDDATATGEEGGADESDAPELEAPEEEIAEEPTEAEATATAEARATVEAQEAAIAQETHGRGYPVTIESAGGTFTLEAPPERIISLSPSATEMLFAMGAGDQVVAVDEFSNYPPEAPTTELSGWDPNVEAIVAYEPDLLVLANDANDLIASATALGIPVFVSGAPVDVESGYATFAELGRVVGRLDETAAAIATMREEVAAALALAPQADLRIYHELDDTYYSASSFGFVGAVYAEMGVTNIADAADADGYGFPQLSQEYIVEADPQLIVITDEVGYTPDDVAARPGWDQISAVENGNIVIVDADTASRWGPRLPQFITTVAEALTAAAVPAG